MSDFETRFGGIARLYGKDGLQKLRAAHVGVVGIGGVGAWAAESRSYDYPSNRCSGVCGHYTQIVCVYLRLFR